MVLVSFRKVVEKTLGKKDNQLKNTEILDQSCLVLIVYNFAYHGRMNLNLGRALVELKRVFKSEESRFILFTGLKVSAISFFISVFVGLMVIEVMRLNYAFFKSQGFPDFGGQTPYYDFLTSGFIDNLYVLFAFHIIIFFLGCYVGWLILRPFKTIGEYCERVLEYPNAIYKVDEYSTYKLLTRFSEFFFEYLRESRKKGVMTTNSIPPQFLGIHKPVVDKIFMLHFGLLLVIISISSAVFTIQNTTSIFENMIVLASKTLPNARNAERFFSGQMFIIDDMIALTIVLISVGYIGLGFHLYDKVSGAAFGIFSTMRSFMKGNYFSRVHLLGYAYIRDYTRKLNKYLDYIEQNLNKEKNKE